MSQPPTPQTKTDLCKTFPERLIFAMNLRNLRNKDLADALYVSASTVSDYRTGHRAPSMEQLMLLSIRLDVTTDFLLGLDDAYLL